MSVNTAFTEAGRSAAEDQQIFGTRLRELRTSRRLSMRDLAELSGVSASYISQIENGRANASLQTLRNLASAFGVAWVDFFQAPPARGRVLRKADRPVIPGPGTRHHSITQPPLLDVEVTVTEYEPGAVVGDEDYVHGDSHEVFVVLSGRFVFRLDDQDFEMTEGDSIELRTSVPHMLTNVGPGVGEGLWVVTPPSRPS